MGTGVASLGALLIFAGVIAASGPLAVGLLAVGAACGVGVLVLWSFRNMLVKLFGLYCDPCSLACFVNCPDD